MTIRTVLGLALALPSLLAGCSDVDRTSYKYKLTISVDTPTGVKTGSSVVTILVSAGRTMFASGGSVKANGEALYLDLGPGQRPLVALLSEDRARRYGKDQSIRGMWEENRPTLLLLKLYGDKKQPEDQRVDREVRLSKLRGVRTFDPVDLPQLVTFADPKDPSTVMHVHFDNPSIALQQNVKWKSLTLEVTDEPVTRGLEQKLPWLNFTKEVLPGKSTNNFDDQGLSLAGSLSTWAFVSPHRPKGTK
jgi:hypothetical protein